MDSITQATLGAAVGEWILGKRLGNRAIAWGAVVGTLPDLDILLAPFFDTAGQLWWHRGPSHSLLIMVLASILLAKPFARWWAKDKVSPARAGCFIFLVWSTHVLIDCFTIYGTSVLWPFSEQRIAFNNLFIIDPLFTLPMFIALAVQLFLRSKAQAVKRRRWNAWGLGLASAYAALSFGFKGIASYGFGSDLERRETTYLRRIEAPTPFNILLWRAVVERDKEFWVGYRSIIEGPSSPVHWTIYPKGHDTVAKMGKLREMQTVDWFSDGWWIARPHAKGAWIGDLRFGEMRTWGNREGMVDNRFGFAWDLLPDAEHDHLRTKARQAGNAKEMMRRLAWRTLGKYEAWDANPRLEGVSGSLPEFLAVEK